MRRPLLALFLLVGCSNDSSRQTDTWPIPLRRAPIAAGKTTVGGLLARTKINGEEFPLVVDTAFPGSALAKIPCPSAGRSNWNYSGTLAVFDGVADPAPLRAIFRNVGLFDICPGAVGSGDLVPSGILGGSTLLGFSLALTLPAAASESPTMTLWPQSPAPMDDWFAKQGMVSLRFTLRGQALLSNNGGDNTLTLPGTRVVLGACLAPDQFTASQPSECKVGDVAKRATGTDALLVVGTGTGPLVIGETAYARIAARLGIPASDGSQGELFTPLNSAPIPARFVTLPRLALFTSATNDTWLGACAELGRARRIEWAMQAEGACLKLERCDVDGDKAHASSPYLELGDGIPTAIVSETSALFLSLNMDAPPSARVDGMIGAGTLAGTSVEIDYLSKPQGRFIASCEAGPTRSPQCFAAPFCPPLSKEGQTHRCFGLGDKPYRKLCGP